MTDGIEKTLGLTSLKDAIAENDEELANELENQMQDIICEDDEINELHSSGVISNNADFLGISGVQHDRETDDIRHKAIDAFDKLMTVGQNVDPMRSARLFEVAGQFLKTAQDSTNDKLNREINVAKLKMAARKIESAEGITGLLETGTEVMADRNDLIKQMISHANGPVVDGEVEDDDETDTSHK